MVAERYSIAARFLLTPRVSSWVVSTSMATNEPGT